MEKGPPLPRRRHHHMIGLVSLAAWAALGSAAMGANQTVSVGNDKTLSPNSGNASITRGDTITWRWVGPDANHIIESDNTPPQAEVWESDPAGANEDNHNVGDTFLHTFTHVGAFQYHCRVHPDKMFGTITVSGNAPVAAFTMTPPAATVGQRVDFDGMGSSDPDGVVMGWDWDLDGDGSFETTGATPNRTYSSPGTVTVRLRVTDNDSTTTTATKNLVVSAAQPPAPPTIPPVTPAPLTPPILTPAPAVAKLTVTGAAKQRSADTRGVVVRATCDLGCLVTVTGTIVLPGGKKIVLPRSSKSLTAARALKIVVTVPKKSRAALQAAWKKGKMATATIVLKTAQGTTVKRVVKLAR